MTSNVAEFYKNKNIFITGGTGFLGVALIDKLLRACPDVSSLNLFLLLLKEYLNIECHLILIY